jgi:ribose/xylose/arabinose/galactoside ABC-type transport system permease subunit
MTAIARVLARAFPFPPARATVFRQIALLCAAGLFVALLIATYGLDLSPGFF